MFKKLYRALDVFNVLTERVFLSIASLSLVVIMFVVSANALSRYFLGSSIRGSFELSEYILLYFTFLSAPYLIRINGHATFDIVITVVPKKVKNIMLFISLIISLFVCAILTKYSFDVAVSNYNRNIIVQNNLMTPRYLLIGIIPIGGLLMCTELIQKIWSVIIRIPDRNDLSFETFSRVQ